MHHQLTKALFGKKSRLIGRRFPIVHIDIGRGDVIEVSSLPQLPFTQKLSRHTNVSG